VQVVDGLGVLLGIDGDGESKFLFWRLARSFAIGAEDKREVRDAVLGKWLPRRLAEREKRLSSDKGNPRRVLELCRARWSIRSARFRAVGAWQRFGG
jgi:hypothetical protein